MEKKKSGLLSRIIQSNNATQSLTSQVEERTSVGLEGFTASGKQNVNSSVVESQRSVKKDVSAVAGIQRAEELTKRGSTEPSNQERHVRRSFSIKEETAKKLEKLAELADRPVSRIVEKALGEYFERLEKDVSLNTSK